MVKFDVCAYAEGDAAVYTEAYTRAYAKSKSKIYPRAYAKVYIDTIIKTKGRVATVTYLGVFTTDYPGADPKAKARAEAADTKADTEAKVIALTSLYTLAIDCLRLSTYFFHPIQQCAQQVYHTAVPLSPTSTQLYESCLQSVVGNQLSYVATFLGAPNTWGSLLRAIDTRPRQLTYIMASGQRIIAACKDIVNIYDAVTFVLQQSLHTPEPVTKTQDSLDGSVLFFVHSFSVTMLDVQTGGLINTFTAQSKVNDIAISATHVTCGSSDGSVILWDIHTTELETKVFGEGPPVVSIYWKSALELVVVTQNSICIWNTTGTLEKLIILGEVWGAVYLSDRSEFLVGVLWPGASNFRSIKYKNGHLSKSSEPPMQRVPGQLMYPLLVDKDIACIASPNGVRLFNTVFSGWTSNNPLLDAATSIAISLNRNLVVQTRDSIQIFPIDILTSGKAQENRLLSHIYPLGENHIVCILPGRHLIVLQLEDLQILGNIRPVSLFKNKLGAAHASFGYGPVAEAGFPLVVKIWQSGTLLPEQPEAAEEGTPLCGWSPECTRIAKVYSSPQQELHVIGVKDRKPERSLPDPRDRTILAKLSLEGDNLGMGEVYDITFDSERRFHLKIDGPGQHIQVPYDIITQPSGGYSHTIVRGEPLSLSEPRVMPPYTLDANCEWVLDAKSRKVCWIPPENLRRSHGNHFWAGLSLLMLGDDSVVRKLTFKDPDI